MNVLLQVKRREFVQCLVELVSTAISYKLLDDADDLMGCIRQLRPKLDQLDYFDGWIAILRGDWQGAMRIAQGGAERTADWPFATALLAYCQYATGDKTWAVTAERVLDHDEAGDAQRLMRMLLGRIDPAEIGTNEAILNAISSGQEMRIESNFVRA